MTGLGDFTKADIPFVGKRRLTDFGSLWSLALGAMILVLLVGIGQGLAARVRGALSGAPIIGPLVRASVPGIADPYTKYGVS